MSDIKIERLKTVNSFESLVEYLRDELYWPIEVEDAEDITFDYDPKDLGIEERFAAKIKTIKQIRPLTDNQPWGLFFIEFEPKKLPVEVLRRILRTLIHSRRYGDDRRATWELPDLIFISSLGEIDERKISFAHFTESQMGIPELRTFSWDSSDTYLHYLQNTLDLDKLRWPENDHDSQFWREQWTSAFTLRHREVIRTAKDLALKLADLATSIRNRVNLLLNIETQSGPLRKLYNDFRTALIHDMFEDDFADMYAQTITYGLLAAHMSHPGITKTNDNTDKIPITNPFLNDLLNTLFTTSDLNDKLDFDELGIQEIINVLNSQDTHMDAILRDFGDLTRQEDPVIHFYELFLKIYDKKKKVERGVFYTPQPIVRFIVRSIHEILQKEFSLKDGLADISTWSKVKENHPNIKIPSYIKSDEPFVQILDPAVGTATFLVEIVDIIFKTMTEKWKTDGKSNDEINTLWNEYVPNHLLPRIFGFELMMAPYAIAHMKLGLKLYETGYKFRSNECAHIYLTNSLEPPKNFIQIGLFSKSLAKEAKTVNMLKREKYFSIIVGNPPYAGHSSNLTKEIRRIVEPYKYIESKKIIEKGALQLEKSIQDDYVKFLRLSQISIDRCGLGIVGLVASHGFLDNPFLRGARFSILQTFNKIFVLDLHGNMLRNAKCPDGSPDKNVFDIKQTGIAIFLLRKNGLENQSIIQHAEIWGDRDSKKYPWLLQNTIFTTTLQDLEIRSPLFLFIPQDLDIIDEYEKGFSISKIMPLYSKGVVTGRDAFVIDFDTAPLIERMKIFAGTKESDDQLIEKYRLNPTDWWKIEKARRKMRSITIFKQYIRPLLYRPFDNRVCFYHPAVLMSPRRPVMKHIDPGLENYLLITSRMTKGESFKHVTASKGLAEAILLSSKTSNNAIVFPLYIYHQNEQKLSNFNQDNNRIPNFSSEFIEFFQNKYRLKIVNDLGDFISTIGVEDIFHYIFSILHSQKYRIRYSDPLSRDFPRVPMTSNLNLMQNLCRYGNELVSLHLMGNPISQKRITEYVEYDSQAVEKIIYSNEAIWINKSQTCGFLHISEQVWNFKIGGYQVCRKWLKDRKGRNLSKNEINHFQNIINNITEIIKIMKKIDDVIDENGGWPIK